MLHTLPDRPSSALLIEPEEEPLFQEEPLRLEWVSSATHIPAELWHACFPAPLEGVWHYRALEGGVLASETTFAYGVLRRGRRMTGIVPTFLLDAPVAAGLPKSIAKLAAALERFAPRFLRTKTLFVGSPTAVCGTVGMRPGEDLASTLACVAPMLEARAKEAGARLIAWKGFPSPEHAAFEQLVSAFGFQHLPDYPGTRMPVPRSWDAYTASLNGRKRYRLRKKLRQSHEAATLQTEVLRSPSTQTITEIYALYEQTYRHATHKFIHLTPAYFHRIAKAETANFVLLREPESGRIAAFMLCFIMHPRAVNGTIGLDYRFVQAWNLYFRLWEAAFGFMIASGATEVHSGQTTYRFKTDLGHELVPMTTYIKHRNPIINRLLLPLIRKTMERTNWAEH